VEPERSLGWWLASAAGAGGLPVPAPEEVLARSGSLRWICPAVTDHLCVAHSRNRLSSGAARSGVS
jgi:hypothetical protein